MAANDHYFLKNKVAVFYRSPLNEENTSLLNIFDNSSVIHHNYFFNEVEISSKLNYFWDKMGEHIKSLTLKSCDICEKVFTFILEKCINLETLSILGCKDLFMSGRLLEGKTEGLFKYNLNDLKSLSLADNQYLTDALFSRFVAASPTLNELNLSACSVQFHIGLIKKFYPSGIDMFESPSESVLTFSFIQKVIASRAESIKHLTLSQTLIDGSNLKILSETDNLRLETLSLYFCDQLTNVGMQALTTHQTTLKSLNLGLCNRVTDQTLVFICRDLVNLEQLNIQRCRAVTNLGIVELQKLKKLKSLNISQCENISMEGLEKGICAEVNKTLQELDLHSLNLDETALIMLSERLPSLQSLNLNYCFNAVTDNSIQVIFKNQVMLKVLKISHCDKVSDGGLTGMGMALDNEPSQDVPTTSYNDEPAGLKIHLGSRAEEEIVRDARRKRDVMLMCEKLSTETYSGYSLARLNYLRELDLSNCSRITDVSLTYAFKFNELIEVNLSRCQQITYEGMVHLVRKCPAIECLNLTDCYNLKDDAVLVIVQGLRRLKQLELKVRDIYVIDRLESMNKLHVIWILS